MKAGTERESRQRTSENTLEKMLCYKSFLIEGIFLSRFTFVFGTWRLNLSLVRCQEPQNTWKCRAVTDVIKDTLPVRTVHLPHWSNFSWWNCNLDCNLHLILILDNSHTNQKGLDLEKMTNCSFLTTGNISSFPSCPTFKPSINFYHKESVFVLTKT